ncbi:MAG TPA: ABC transporter substrate-binding protein [Chloroflexota bacterium]|jgi:iron(III) transport system substrate-binding protein
MSNLGAWLSRVVGVVCLLIVAACGPAAGSGAPAARPAAAPDGAPVAAPGAQAAAPGSATGTVGAPAAAAASPAMQALIDGARREGQLNLVWGETTAGGVDAMPRLTAGFNRLYGLNLDVRFTPGPSMPSMAAKIADEYRAGRPASSDVMVGFGGHIVSLVQADALEPVDWASWAPNVQEPRLTGRGGRAVTFQTSLQGLSYNTERVRPDEVPKTLEDLLKPQYKGRIASTPYASGFDRLPVPELWGEQRTLDFVRRFADQLGGLIRCLETQRIVSGEFDMLALDCSPSNTLSAKAKGAPVDYAILSDAPFAQLLYMAVPKNAAHPNAAKLWINYMLSREGQDVIYDTNFIDSHLVPGSKTAPWIAQLQAAGGKIMEIDLDFYEAHDEREMQRVLDEIVKILQKQ